MTDQLRRTLTLLETLLDYLPGPQMMRSQADAVQVGVDRRPSGEYLYTPAERDRQLAHLEHQARMRKNDHSRGSEAWETARRDQYRQGDYALLDKALLDLEGVQPLWHRLAWRVATHHPGVLDQALRVELVRSVVWLSERLPRPARVPEWTHRAAPASPLHIAALRELGVPYAVLARVYGRDASVISRRAKKRMEVA